MEHVHTPLHSEHDLHQAAEATNSFVNATAGCWKLSAGRAFTIRAGRAGVLRIAHGRVWATLELADGDDSARAGDHFLSRGEGIALQAGQSLVLEPFAIGHASPAFFSWEPEAARALAFQPAAQGWRAEVLQPLSDLRAAGGLAFSALVRLSSGVVRNTAASAATLVTLAAAGFVARRSTRHTAAPGDEGADHAVDFYYAQRAHRALQAGAAVRLDAKLATAATGSLQPFAV